MKKPAVLLFFAFLFVLFSCKKESGKPNWDVDALTPLASSELGMNQLISDTLLMANADSSLKLVYNNEVYNFTLSNLFSIPDTASSNDYLMLPGNYAPGTSGPVINNQTKFNVTTVELKTVIIKSGHIKINATSTIKERMVLKYQIPGASKNGVPFEINVEVPAATASSSGSISSTFDLADYTFDLRGQNHNSANTVYSLMVASVPADANTAVIALGDHISINNSFEQIVPYYAKGYFGQMNFEVPPTSTPLTLFKNLSSGKIGLESVKMTLSLENNIGIDAQASIHYLSAINSRSGDSISLNNSNIGPSFRINRAIENPFSSTLYSMYMDNTNSNAKSFVETLPDKAYYSMRIETNPGGNQSGGNDFVFYDKGLKVKLDLEIPLSLSADQLVLLDTSAFSLHEYSNLHRILGGNFIFRVQNGFPFEGALRIKMADVNGVVIDSMFSANSFKAAPVDANYKVSAPLVSELLIPASPEHINNIIKTKWLYISANLNTKPSNHLLKIYSDYKMGVKVIGDFSYHVN